ncbi:MAG: sigma 54-interacting transcriptional regulator [Deltaproteobacteria bacterium]|nr:sigma 54-interacting transcriptional regulator [Deltaproteobacteria bacterium]
MSTRAARKRAGNQGEERTVNHRGAKPRALEPEPAPPPPAARAALRVRVHHEHGGVDEHELSPWRAYTFGRVASADLLVDTERASRMHGTLLFHDGWVVADANSTNGTLVGRADELRRSLADDSVLHAARLGSERHPLLPGDAVLVGTRRAWIEVLEPAAPGEPREHDGDDTARSEAARTLARALESAARHRRSVLLIGPSGAGKTHAAEHLHAIAGARGRLVVVNCAGLPSDPTQLRSVLFGHTKGAFTGALTALQGLVFAADGGTLLLDEVESLHPAAQGFLLDVIEGRGALLPLGAAPHEQPAPPALRIIAAAKTRLAASTLRADLQFRLGAGDIIRVPSLVDRRADIPGLARRFLGDATGNAAQRTRFAPEALALLQDARWPGELRQLRGVVEACRHAACERADDGVHVVVTAGLVRERLALEHAMYGDEGSRDWDDQPTSHDARRPPSMVDAIGAPSCNPHRLTDSQVREALLVERGNIERAARRLGIARRTLMAKMDRFGVDRPLRRR